MIKTRKLYNITEFNNINFEIFDFNKETYNIGDLLNMPYFFNDCETPIHYSSRIYKLYIKAAEFYKGSILNIYHNMRTDPNEPMPNVQKIRDSVDKYIENISNMQTIKTNNLMSNIDINHINTLLNICMNEKTLVIHLRSGDQGIVENNFINKINTISNMYDTVLIICGIHHSNYNDKTLPHPSIAINNLKISLSKLYNNKKIFVDISEPDIHLCIMRKAKNLLLHKGGFSILGSLLFNGDNLYLTQVFFPNYCNNLTTFNNVVKDYIVI